MKRALLTAVAFAFCAISLYGQTQTVRIFSHRGGRMEHDENTIEAFKASYDAGYRGYETDVRMTSDGELVITHDSKLDRTTNGTGAVELKTASEIRGLYTKKGNKMLFLDELLDFLKGQKGLYVEFELKTKPVELYPEERLHEYCDKLYKKVMEAKPADATFVFTSGDYRGLRYLQQKYPGIDLLLITSKPVNEETINLCRAMGITRLGAKIGGTSRDAVAKAHEKGLTVSLWPGSCPEDTMLGIYLGADFLCTDVPIAVKEHITKEQNWVKAIY